MNKPVKRPASSPTNTAPAALASAWRWSRLIARADGEQWTEKLSSEGGCNWMIVENPSRVRLRVEAYFSSRRAAQALVQKYKGKVESFRPAKPAPAQPVRVNSRLEIAHDEEAKLETGRLIIRYGMAFGSGEHATTLMLLRALARRNELGGLSVLDLGTGSGVLAIAARSLGAKQVAATDFDPAAIRTARHNELLNFPSRRIRWTVADVKKLSARPRYQLIIANLFSGILMDAASRLARALAPGGELWLSGILRSQAAEVVEAYRKSGLRLIKTTTRGKWIMQEWGTITDASSR